MDYAANSIDVGGFGLPREFVTSSWVDEPEIEVKVRQRPTSPYPAHGRWSERDFDLLITAVPWLAPDGEESPMSAEDLARIPGPLDIAMF